MTTKTRPECWSVVVGITLLALVDGCSNEFGAPPPGEARRKAAAEAGEGGAASIEELRKAYAAAHRKKDFKALDNLCGLNLILPKWLPRGELSPTQLAMREITKFPIRTVEFEASPARATRDGEVSYRNQRNKVDSTVGDIRGKLILVMANGERLDASYIVLNYYGRFVLGPNQLVVKDAAQHLKTGRPCDYVPIPMDSPQRRRDPQSPGDVILGR